MRRKPTIENLKNEQKLAMHRAMLLAVVLTFFALGAKVIKYGYPYIFGDGWVILGENTSYPGRLSAYEQSAAPSGTVTDRWDVYPKSDGWYQQSDGGAEARLATEDDLAGFGDVSGPASSVDNEPARFSGTTGKLIQGGTGWTWDDNGILEYSSGSHYIKLNRSTGDAGSIELKGNGTSSVVAAMVNGDSEQRIMVFPGGRIDWGSGSSGQDVGLYRSAAGVLTLDEGNSGTFGSFRIKGSTADPSSPSAGQIFYRTDTAELKVYDGSGWAVLNGGGFSGISLAGDIGTPQTLADGDTLTVTGGDGIGTTVSATDTVTIDVDTTVVRGAGTKTSDTTVANTTTKTAVYSWTVAADGWADLSQCQLDLFMRGTAFTGTPSLTVTIEDGTNTLFSATFSSLGSGSFAGYIKCLATCRSTGASGTVETTGIVNAINSAGTAVNYWSPSNTDTIDTTGSNTYTVYLQWSAANAFNSMTVSSAGVIRLD